jgi:hypothetical protein
MMGEQRRVDDEERWYGLYINLESRAGVWPGRGHLVFAPAVRLSRRA